MKGISALLFILSVSGCATVKIAVDDACPESEKGVATKVTVPLNAQPAEPITAATISHALRGEVTFASLAAKHLALRANGAKGGTSLSALDAAVGPLKRGALSETSNDMQEAVVAAKKARDVVNAIRDAVWPAIAVGDGASRGGSQILSFGRSTYPSPEAVAAVAQANGFGILALHNLGVMHQMSDANNSKGEMEKTSEGREVELRMTTFLHVYIKAYLRHGAAFQVSADVKDISSTLARELSSSIKLPGSLSSDQEKQIRDLLKSSVGEKLSGALLATCRGADKGGSECLLTRALGDDKFVSRAGLGVQFAGISANIGAGGALKATFNYPPATDFGPQIARVAVEAAFDSLTGGPPGVATATGCNEPTADNPILGKDLCLTPADENDKADPREKMALAAYEDANKAEAAATSTAATVIRGISIVALNNEAVAKSVETGIGVTARKLAERISWAIRNQCKSQSFTGPRVAVYQ